MVVHGLSFLTPSQLADLRASGLTDETISKARIYNEPDRQRVASMLNWKRCPRNWDPGQSIVFQFWQLDGTVNGYCQVKPDRPRIKDGKPLKYESPAGVPSRAYFPPAAIATVLAPQAPLLITEGVKKALCASQHGMPCIALAHVWNWQLPRKKDVDGRGQGPRILIPDLQTINWTDRPVGIVFDADPRRNPSVNQAAVELAIALEEMGAQVK